MKCSVVFVTSLLGSWMVLQQVSLGASSDSITTGTVKTATAPITQASINDPRVAAANFVEHVNFARVALALKNPDLASQHITQARNMSAIIKTTTIEQQRTSDLQSGRVVYDYDTEYKNHYFPIQTPLVQVKEVSKGPLWASDALAVTDADIVSLTLDLSGDRADAFLNAAEKAIAERNGKEADRQLARLIDTVVTIDTKIEQPADKARDNIALARSFLAMKNYNGARYALHHAKEALGQMQSSDTDPSHRQDIITMGQEISALETTIKQKDPHLLRTADERLSAWWNQLKSWTHKEMQGEAPRSESSKPTPGFD